jgi:hypothetical protein
MNGGLCRLEKRFSIMGKMKRRKGDVPPKYISFMKSLTSWAVSTCGMTIPAQPASSAVVRLISSFFGTRQMAIDFPSE